MPRILALSVVILLFSACTSIPVSTMFKLSRLNPMEADPAQIKIAIRANEAIGIPYGAARITLGYETLDKSIVIEDTYLIEMTQSDTLPVELKKGKRRDEVVTILQLSAEDAERMRKVQTRVRKDRARAIEGNGYLGVGLHDTCLKNRELPEEDLNVDIFMQTSNDDGFFMFTENFDITESQHGWNGDLSIWPTCAE